jgi:hypothetical protein
MRECQVYFLNFERTYQNPVLTISFGPSIIFLVTLLLGTWRALPYSATL